MRIGMYSTRAVESGMGVSIWSTPSGGEAAVTAVVSDPEHYFWPDAVEVGEVVGWVRTAVPGTFNRTWFD